MRVTIIPVDGVVGVDGAFKQVDGLTALFPGVHAIQWDGTAGHIEFTDGSPNVTLADSDVFAEALAAFHAIVPPPPPDPASEKVAVLAQARFVRETVLNRLTGIQVAGADAPTIAAIQA